MKKYCGFWIFKIQTLIWCLSSPLWRWNGVCWSWLCHPECLGLSFLSTWTYHLLNFADPVHTLSANQLFASLSHADHRQQFINLI